MATGCSFFCLTVYLFLIGKLPGALSPASQLTCFVLNEYRMLFLLPHSLRASNWMNTGCSFSCLTAYVPRIEWIPGDLSPVSQLTCFVLNEYRVLLLLPHSLRASNWMNTGCSISCLTAYVPRIEWIPGALSPASQLTCLLLNEYGVLFFLPHSVPISHWTATGCSFSCLTAYVPRIEWIAGALSPASQLTCLVLNEYQELSSWSCSRRLKMVTSIGYQG